MKKTVTVSEVTNYELYGVKVLGDASLLEKCKNFIICNFEGYVCAIMSSDKLLYRSDLYQLEPCDKGGLSVFGVNELGNVICGMAYFENEPEGNIAYVLAKNYANPWNYS